MSLAGSSRCALCRRNEDAEIAYLQVGTVIIEFQRKILKWFNLRCHCCKSCERQIKTFNRIRGLSFPVWVVLVVGLEILLFGNFDRLVAIGIPAPVIPFLGILPPIVVTIVVKSIVKSLSMKTLPPELIARFQAAGIGWDAGSQSVLLLSRQPLTTLDQTVDFT